VEGSGSTSSEDRKLQIQSFIHVLPAIIQRQQLSRACFAPFTERVVVPAEEEAGKWKKKARGGVRIKNEHTSVETKLSSVKPGQNDGRCLLRRNLKERQL
jgi:hypothetical protein